MTGPIVYEGRVWEVEGRTATGLVWATDLETGYRTLLLPRDLGLAR